MSLLFNVSLEFEPCEWIFSFRNVSKIPTLSRKMTGKNKRYIRLAMMPNSSPAKRPAKRLIENLHIATPIINVHSADDLVVHVSDPSHSHGLGASTDCTLKHAVNQHNN